MEAIELKELSRRYGARTAVDRLSFSVGEGELFALLGTNGAGKTTTIKMLSGLLQPSGGDALLLGHSVRQEPHTVKEFLNVSPQETAVAPSLSVRENLEFIARVYGGPRTEAADRAAGLMKELSLEEAADRRAKTLSGGWQRRLSIAMALISRPRILFLDEPTLGLDVLARRELWQFIRSLQGRVTIILTTHYLEEAEALADRIAILADGRLCALGTAAELKTQTGTDNFEDAFVALAGAKGEKA